MVHQCLNGVVFLDILQLFHPELAFYTHFSSLLFEFRKYRKVRSVYVEKDAFVSARLAAIGSLVLGLAGGVDE